MRKHQLYKDVIDILKQNPQYQKAEKILDYNLESYSRVSELEDDDIRFVHTTVDEGSCEGIYVDLVAETRDEVMNIATWKTLDTSPEAYADMGVIAGLATWAAYKAWREAA